MESFEPEASDELASVMDEWSSLIREAAHLAGAVGTSNSAGPRQGSPFAVEIEELGSYPTMPAGALELVALDTVGYLSAAGRHCSAVSKLLAAREAFISLMPLLRAQLETYGRIAWFLEPVDAVGQRIVPHRRVARHHMDALASICRRRYTASRRGESQQVVKEIKKDRGSVRAQTLAIFPSAELGWAEPNDEATWRCGDDDYLGLGGGATLFGRVVLAGASGSYDSLSDFAHPSIITNRQLTRPVEQDGYLSYNWHVEQGDVARQVWNCGAMHISAAKLIASWFGLPAIDELDDFLDRLATATKAERVHS